LQSYAENQRRICKKRADPSDTKTGHLIFRGQALRPAKSPATTPPLSRWPAGHVAPFHDIVPQGFASNVPPGQRRPGSKSRRDFITKPGVALPRPGSHFRTPGKKFSRAFTAKRLHNKATTHSDCYVTPSG